MAITGSIDGERRRAELVAMASDAGGLEIEQAALRFEVSTMTIRRDLDLLERDGLIRRVRGGAVAHPAPQSYGERLSMHAGAKRTIAQKARGFLPDRGAVAMDASTTVNALVPFVGEQEGLVVCTNSLQTFEALGAYPGTEALLTGGAFEPVTGSLVGPLANASARALRTDVFFTSAAGAVSALGTSEASLAEAEVKRVFASCAERVLLCLDSSKLGVASLGGALDFSDIAVLITELDPGDARLDEYRKVVEIV